SGDTWYVFGSGGRHNGPQLPILCSADLPAPNFSWTRCGSVFPSIPAWILARLPGVQDLWAPDISFVDGEYRLYYAFSLLGKNTSGIALATNKTLDRTSPDYAWTDRGLILESRSGDDFNAIDPNFLRDPQGQDWLVFGSFWTGIKLRRLAPDGTLSKQDKHTYSLARRTEPPDAPYADSSTPADWQAIEGPFLIHHGSYFYLFTSWDHCCMGAASNYRIVVGRSQNIRGPYLDQGGKKLTKGGGTTILSGNTQWAGPGGQSIYTFRDGTSLIAFHAYDRTTGTPWLQISPIHWIEDWPQIQFPDDSSEPSASPEPSKAAANLSHNPTTYTLYP
ncbi:MAG TPA: arabinan endo-1,5-alpha-L-arabinosidase, partial [Acidobacteriaceae bacterium]